MKNKVKLLSELLFYGGVVVSLFGFYKVWEIKSKLPEGTCPVTDNREILILGLIMLVLSLIIEEVYKLVVKKVK